jgi:hypothetical protein
MEEVATVALVAIALPLAYLVADIVGLCMGLGWRHYSKRRKASRAKEKLHIDD